VATTTTDEVYRLDLGESSISVFADRATTDLATGAAVGDGLASPDSLALDHDGHVYIVEDRGGGIDDDIWFAKDLNDDGDLTDAGEGSVAGRPTARPARRSPGSTSTRGTSAVPG
jgi:hypothetical protein